MSEQLTVTAEDRLAAKNWDRIGWDDYEGDWLGDLAEDFAAHRIKALEQAAGVAETHDEWAARYGNYQNQAIADETAKSIATAIRALKDTSHD